MKSNHQSAFFSQEGIHSNHSLQSHLLDHSEIPGLRTNSQHQPEEIVEKTSHEKMMEISQNLMVGAEEEEFEEMKERIETIKEQLVFQRKNEGTKSKKHLGTWRYFID